MSENTRRIQQGDIYKIDGQKCRVFAIETNYVGVIGLEKLFIRRFDALNFLKDIRDGLIVKCADEVLHISMDISEDEWTKVHAVEYVMDTVLKDTYPSWENLTKARYKKKEMREAAEMLDYDFRYFNQKFFAYLRSGRNVYSLIDQRHFKGLKDTKNTKERNVLEDNSSKCDVLTNQDIAYEDGLREFKSILKVQGAYDYVISKYYSTLTCEMKNGVLEEVLIPHEKIPSYSSFYRYVSSHLGGRTVTQYIKGERETRNNDRFLTGNQRSGMITIGQYIQVDECEVAVDLVSDDGTEIIGKPVMYCAFEPVSQMIIGAYIGLTNNSMSGFVNLFLSMLEPHNHQTEPYGVTCNELEFPSMVIPKNIYSDQGSEYTSGHMAEAMLELGIVQSIVPAAAGSYKGGVENCFHRLQSRLKTLLIHDGYILPTHDGAQKARQNACLTMHDFKAIVYRMIIELNTTSLGKLYSPDADMIENHVPSVPCEIWKHKMQNCYDPISVTDENRMQIMFALLWRNKKFDRGRDGLTYRGHNLRYFINEDWFKELLVEKSPVFDVRYDDTDVSCIYVRYKKLIHKVPLAVSRDELRSYIGMTWCVYDDLYKQHKSIMQEQKKTDMKIRLSTMHQNEKVRNQARDLHEDIVNDKKQIRENRAKQRVILETDKHEIRNRLLEKDLDVETDVSEPNDTNINKSILQMSRKDILAEFEDEE